MKTKQETERMSCDKCEDEIENCDSCNECFQKGNASGIDAPYGNDLWCVANAGHFCIGCVQCAFIEEDEEK